MTTPIAIIEDDPQSRQRFGDVIAAAGLKLLGCAADVAPGRTRRANTLMDVFLIDLGWPALDRAVRTREAIARHPDCDVLVGVRSADDAHIFATIEATATGYLRKNRLSEGGAACFRMLADNGSAVSPLIARKTLRNLRGDGARAFADKPAAAPAMATAPAPAVNRLPERVVQMVGLQTTIPRYGEIGIRLRIAARMAVQHVSNLYRTGPMHSRGEAAYAAITLGVETS